MARSRTHEETREAFTVRLPAGYAQGLREYRLFTGTPASEVIERLVGDFLASPGREEIARGMTRRAQEMYGPALDKLADS